MNTKLDRVVVWGSEVCPNCAAVCDKLARAGFVYEKKDLEAELSNEAPMLRREIMSAYAFEQALPVVQVNDRAFTPKEAFDFLGTGD